MVQPSINLLKKYIVMPAIFLSKDILVDYYNNPVHPAWAKDLICRAINTNGTIEQEDLDIILDEILNEVTTPSLVIPANFGWLIQKFY